MKTCDCDICEKNRRGMKTFSGLCVKSHLVRKMAKEISDEIDNDILRDVRKIQWNPVAAQRVELKSVESN